MPILDKQNKEQVEKYNNFVRNYKGASLMQDINWADVKTEWINEIVYLEKYVQLEDYFNIYIKKVLLKIIYLKR